MRASRVEAEGRFVDLLIYDLDRISAAPVATFDMFILTVIMSTIAMNAMLLANQNRWDTSDLIASICAWAIPSWEMMYVVWKRNQRRRP